LSSTLDELARRLAAYRPLTEDSDPVLRWAAVAVVLVPDPDAVLLIRRAEAPGDPWSGHMALPGGRRSPDDLDLAAAAIRETAEEVGVPLRRDALLGTLDDIAPRTPVLPPIAVRPFVFRLAARADLTLNHEVAAAAWVPLEILRHPDTYQTITLHLHGSDVSVAAYRYEQAVVWGMTERILSCLLALITES
jgi:8-oxo-dGTP pyrophosphatase MutT (NUDIX family)